MSRSPSGQPRHCLGPEWVHERSARLCSCRRTPDVLRGPRRGSPGPGAAPPCPWRRLHDRVELRRADSPARGHAAGHRRRGAGPWPYPGDRPAVHLGELRRRHRRRAGAAGDPSRGRARLQRRRAYRHATGNEAPSRVRRPIVASAFYRRDGLVDGFRDGIQHASLEAMPEIYKRIDRELNPDPRHLEQLFMRDRERTRAFRSGSSRAPGISRASARPCSRGNIGSAVPWITSVRRGTAWAPQRRQAPARR